ncbi:TetR/AcrR family transcriptional regulator [Candidatus Symbiopectobacterium sp. NZEC135]|uniref:TetR/AcrR family transcriptional regulator n=1 Tax=Candidatus Symbiopectobacterium sp. NZEC135 TaxID=2820471 RepID=UPI002225C141|nr:TetR/AcrR family transcriptional regulator [Candidatus Symbiopectobacterium sp. NZEC135]MCW2481174.1 TetR/AcrR family transcriptional regulator [Candidatus Symbiopectobacterium sp. NZEC135]
MAGRPRQFDIEIAIDTALNLFTEKGYEGASFGELIKAMGINPPSFYAAFGSKEKLFRLVLERYVTMANAATREALAQSTAREVVKQLLTGMATAATSHPTARGCLLVQSALVSSDSASSIRDALRIEREANTAALAARFREAEQSGDKTLPGSPDAIARLTTMILTGIATQAASGIEFDTLMEAVNSYVDQFG